MTTHPHSTSDGPELRVLFLPGPALGWPDREVLLERVARDEQPDVVTPSLRADVVDERYLQCIPGLVGRLVRHLPFPVAQVLAVLRVGGSYDLVLTWHEPATYLLALVRHVVRRPQRHVSVHSWISRPKKSLPLRVLHRGIDRLIVPPVVQRAYALDVMRLPPEKLPTVRWSVDGRFWRPMPGPTAAISCVGREMRDYGTFVTAVRDLQVPCHIAAGTERIVGNPWLGALGQRLPPHVTSGTRRGRDLRDLYARSRVVVVPLVPSDTDNGITAILEAFAMGRPVICSRTPGQVGVVEDGVNGLLVEPGSPDALRAAILRLWDDPAEADRLGANGRALVERHHGFAQWEQALTGR